MRKKDRIVIPDDSYSAGKYYLTSISSVLIKKKRREKIYERRGERSLGCSGPLLTQSRGCPHSKKKALAINSDLKERKSFEEFQRKER